MVAQNDEELIWPDTFAMDGEGNLLVTTNKLVFIIQGPFDWDLPGSNFRIVKMFVDDKSYLLP